MKSFLASIQERADQAKATLAKTAELASLERAHIEAKAERGRYANSPVGYPPKDQAHAACTVASQAVDALRRAMRDAESDMRRYEPILSAHADVAAARAVYAEAREGERHAETESSDLQKLIAELGAEVKDLGAQVKGALAAHGRTTIFARLTGQHAPATPKAISALNLDLESRKVTLEAAEAMLSAAQQRRERARDSAAEARDKWKYARAEVAAIEYHDALATITPQVSMYLAAMQHGYQRKIEFSPGAEALEAARQLLQAEFEQ